MRCSPAVIDDDDDPSAHAADDPTAMWDEDSLAALGLGRPSTESAATASKPATASKRGANSSVEVTLGTAEDPTQGRVGHQTPASRGGGLSWSVTILLAIVLAVSVYLAIRYLR